MNSTEDLLAFVYENVLEMLAEGPVEVTSLRPGDEMEFARALTLAFAMGVQPGLFTGVWTPWPLDIADSAALSVPIWIAERHDAWPEEDSGAVFEHLGVHVPRGGTIKEGSRRRPVRAPRALFHARSWAGPSGDPDGIAAACALLLLTEELLASSRPTRTDSGWKFPGTVPDPRSVLLGWCARILDEPEPAADLASEAFKRVTGWQYPTTRPRRPRAVLWRDGVDSERLPGYLPILEKGLGLAMIARCEGLALAQVEAADRDQLVAFASTVQALAGPHDRVAAQRNRRFDFTWGTALLVELDDRAGQFAAIGDFDPLDAVPDAEYVPSRFATPDAARAAGSLGMSIHDKLEPLKGVTTAAHIVPSAAAVLRSREVTGSWWQRAVAHLERFTTHVQGDPDPRYFDDLVAHEGTFVANNAGLVLLTCRDLNGTRNYETVQALVDMHSAGNAMGEQSERLDKD